MKILLITTLYPGYKDQSKIQATHAVHNFAKEWAKKEEVQVIRIWPCYPKIFECFKKGRKVNKYAYKEEFILDDVNVMRTPILKIPKISYGSRDIKLIAKEIIEIMNKEGKPDVIICDMLNPSIYIGEIVAKELNSILIASLHNTDNSYLAIEKNYRKYIKTDPYIEKIVFRSNKVEKDFLELYDGTKNKKDFLKVFFGIDKKEVLDSHKIEDKISNPPKVILVASSLKQLKKIDVLIEAFARIEDKNGYILKIIGDGPEREILETQVKDLNCEKNIYFEGEKTRDEVLSLMEESNIFAMVSSPETFGLVYVEAMAKGCITIGSKGEGIDGVIVKNSNGFLCIPGDVEDLKETLEISIALKKEERKKIIDNAINTARSLNHEDLADEYLTKIKQI